MLDGLMARHSTADVDDAMRVLRSLYGAPMVLSADPPSGFRFDARAAGSTGIGSGALRCDGAGITTVDAFGDFVVAMSVGGTIDWTVGTHSGTGPAPFVMPPGRRMRSRWRDLRLVTLRLDAAAVRRGRDLRGVPLTTDWATERRDPRYLAAVLLQLERTARVAPEVLADPVLAAAARDGAIAALVATFDGAPDVREVTAPRSVRRALAYIDGHLGEPVAITDIADAAGLTVRALEYAFRRHVGRTPSEALRAARLSSAHEELLRADPDSTTVAAIARRWGFGHPSRFARLHREIYGETPGATLRR